MAHALGQGTLIYAAHTVTCAESDAASLTSRSRLGNRVTLRTPARLLSVSISPKHISMIYNIQELLTHHGRIPWQAAATYLPIYLQVGSA